MQSCRLARSPYVVRILPLLPQLPEALLFSSLSGPRASSPLDNNEVVLMISRSLFQQRTAFLLLYHKE
jgi:hypothetical protein